MKRHYYIILMMTNNLYSGLTISRHILRDCSIQQTWLDKMPDNVMAEISYHFAEQYGEVVNIDKLSAVKETILDCIDPEWLWQDGVRRLNTKDEQLKRLKSYAIGHLKNTNKDFYIIFSVLEKQGLHEEIIPLIEHIGINTPLNKQQDRAIFMFKNIEVVKYLLEKGADIHADDDYALSQAVRENDKPLILLLLSYGADVSAASNRALFWTIKNNNLDMLMLLLENGANLQEICGRTALEWANFYEHAELASIIQDYMWRHP